MEKIRYMISDAATMVNVETHVLRYWEDELELTIPRNEMGHRYYTKENIREFQRIKELKDQGYQLKAIRMILHSGKAEEFATMENAPSATTMQTPTHLQPQSSQLDPASMLGPLTAEDRMAQFRELMTDIVGHAIACNNEELSQNIGQEVEERVLKEMDYLMREQEDAQEERFRKLDAAIRGNLKAKRSIWGKKEKKEKSKIKVKNSTLHTTQPSQCS